MANNKKTPAKKNAPKRGRPFEKGNPGGPGRGNGKDTVCREAITVIRDAVSDDELRAVVKRLLTAARAGNVKAAKLIFEYKAGKPSETIRLAGEVGIKDSRLSTLMEGANDKELRAIIAAGAGGVGSNGADGEGEAERD